MTNSSVLSDLIKKSGYKMEFIASKCGMTRYSLSKKVNNQSEFTCNEALAIGDLLGISSSEMSDIFFCTDVGKMPQ